MYGTAHSYLDLQGLWEPSFSDLCSLDVALQTPKKLYTFLPFSVLGWSDCCAVDNVTWLVRELYCWIGENTSVIKNINLYVDNEWDSWLLGQMMTLATSFYYINFKPKYIETALNIVSTAPVGSLPVFYNRSRHYILTKRAIKHSRCDSRGARRSDF